MAEPESEANALEEELGGTTLSSTRGADRAGRDGDLVVLHGEFSDLIDHNDPQYIERVYNETGCDVEGARTVLKGERDEKDAIYATSLLSESTAPTSISGDAHDSLPGHGERKQNTGDDDEDAQLSRQGSPNVSEYGAYSDEVQLTKADGEDIAIRAADSDPGSASPASDTSTDSDLGNASPASDTSTDSDMGNASPASDTSTDSNPGSTSLSSDTSTDSNPGNTSLSSDTSTDSNPGNTSLSSDTSTGSDPGNASLSSDTSSGEEASPPFKRPRPNLLPEAPGTAARSRPPAIGVTNTSDDSNTDEKKDEDHGVRAAVEDRDRQPTFDLTNDSDDSNSDKEEDDDHSLGAAVEDRSRQPTFDLTNDSDDSNSDKEEDDDHSVGAAVEDRSRQPNVDFANNCNSSNSDEKKEDDRRRVTATADATFAATADRGLGNNEHAASCAGNHAPASTLSGSRAPLSAQTAKPIRDSGVPPHLRILWNADGTPRLPPRVPHYEQEAMDPTNDVPEENNAERAEVEVKEEEEEEEEVVELPVIADGDYPDHANVRSWLVFSDLHVKKESLEICLQVLRHVHRLATEAEGERKGIIFLGDFWHRRRVLCVDQLNPIMEELATWEVPVVMLPGNHDQTELGGPTHGLTPLTYAFKFGKQQAVILSKPTRFLGAVWVPFVQQAELGRIMDRVNKNQPTCTAVFCHAEVRGARLNDGHTSKVGQDVSRFPKCPVYTGHFHTPHEVLFRNRTVRYVGSPYQTSLAEVGDHKVLYEIRRHANGAGGPWSIVEEHGIDIGGRYHRATSIDELEELSCSNSLRNGDIVVLVLPADVPYPTPKSSTAKRRLKEREVTFRFRRSAPTLEAGVARAGIARPREEQSPASVFELFMQEKAGEDWAQDVQGDELKQKMRELILEAECDTDESESTAGVHLQLHNVQLTNFGPFQGRHEYPFLSSNDHQEGRGFVLLRAESCDGAGANSNGAGKTSLAMAALWAFTGNMDPRLRPVQGGKNSRANTAAVARHATRGVPTEVLVEGVRYERGRGNGPSAVSFTVRRTMSGVQVKENGARVPGTNAELNQHLVRKYGTRLLQRAAFFGQHHMNQLLGLTPKDFREKMSEVVDLTVLKRVCETAKMCKRIAETDVQREREDLARQSGRLEQLRASAKDHAQEQQQAETRVRKAHEDLDKAQQDLKQFEDKLSRWCREAKIALDTDTSPPQTADLSCALQAKVAAAEQNLCDKAADLNRWQNRRDTAQRVSQRAKEVLLELSEWVQVGESVESLPQLQILDEDSVAHFFDEVQRQCKCLLERAETELSSVDEFQQRGVKAANKFVSWLLGDARRDAMLAITSLDEENASVVSDCTLDTVTRLRDEAQCDVKEWLNRQQQFVDTFRDEWDQEENDHHTRIVELEEELGRAQTLQSEAQRHQSASIATMGAADKDHACQQDRVDKLEQEVKILGQILKHVFDAKKGILNFTLVDSVQELEQLANYNMSILSDGTMRLKLNVTNNGIVPTAYIDGNEVHVFWLSGGQFRRTSIALELAASQQLQRRGTLNCNVLVFDEVFANLDLTGCKRVLALLKEHRQREEVHTVIAILMDAMSAEVEEEFDAVDVVTRETMTKSRFDVGSA